MAGNENRYKKLQEQGYTLIFKPTISVGKDIKGNCDAELVLQSVVDFYEDVFDKAILVTSDGDFSCLVRFLIEKDKFGYLLSPSHKKCSSLLTRIQSIKIIFLSGIKNKIS